MRSQIRMLTPLVLAGLAIIGGCSDTSNTESTIDEPVPAMDTLVGAEWLMEHIDDPDVVVLDATVIVESDAAGNMNLLNGRDSFEAGHIPNAGFADLLGELSDPDARYEFTLPAPEDFAAAMGALGVGDDTRVVIYDTQNLAWAARVWWMLRWIGFDRAALLDGGLSAWTAAGGELATGTADRAARTLTVNLRPELIADQEDVRASIADESIDLIDSLPEIHYRGEWTMYERPGHIPGAANVPVTSLFDDTGRFRSDDELMTLFGADKDTRTITYCGGGIAASVDAFALTRLGFTDVAIYDGSLEEWTANPENPMDVDLDSFGGSED